MACPFFLPSERLRESPWAHPARLPLGDSWTGQCTVPGHENDCLSSAELKHCNIGYAANYCPRLPAERSCDAVRFSIAENENGRIAVLYICEVHYRPGDHGRLEFDPAQKQWITAHPDPRIQRMAQCVLETFLIRHRATASR